MWISTSDNNNWEYYKCLYKPCMDRGLLHMSALWRQTEENFSPHHQCSRLWKGYEILDSAIDKDKLKSRDRYHMSHRIITDYRPKQIQLELD